MDAERVGREAVRKRGFFVNVSLKWSPVRRICVCPQGKRVDTLQHQYFLVVGKRRDSAEPL